MLFVKSCAGVSVAMQRTREIVPAAISAVLLSACAGMPSFSPDGASSEAGAPMPAHAAAKSKRMRATTAQDILSEWGTFGL